MKLSTVIFAVFLIVASPTHASRPGTPGTPSTPALTICTSPPKSPGLSTPSTPRWPSPGSSPIVIFDASTPSTPIPPMFVPRSPTPVAPFVPRSPTSTASSMSLSPTSTTSSMSLSPTASHMSLSPTLPSSPPPTPLLITGFNFTVADLEELERRLIENQIGFVGLSVDDKKRALFNEMIRAFEIKGMTNYPVTIKQIHFMDWIHGTITEPTLDTLGTQFDKVKSKMDRHVLNEGGCSQFLLMAIDMILSDFQRNNNTLKNEGLYVLTLMKQLSEEL